MSFVFGHGAKPFPCGDFSRTGSRAFALQVVVRQPGEDFHGLGVELFHQRQNVFVAIGKLLAVRGITARTGLEHFPPTNNVL